MTGVPCQRELLLSIPWLWLLVACAALSLQHSTAARAFELGEPYFESLIDSEALPDNIVSALAQDAQGFLWVGTNEALLRFDGYRFERILGERGRMQSPAGLFAMALCVARDGRIYVGTGTNGLWRFDPRSGQSLILRHDSANDGSLANDSVLALVEDIDGALWIANNAGLDRWFPDTSTFTHVNLGMNPSMLRGKGEPITALLIDRRGDLWAGGSAGLLRRQAGKTDFEPISAKTSPDRPLITMNVERLLEARDGHLWIGTAENTVFVLDPVSLQLQRAEDADDPIQGTGRMPLVQPRDDEIWVGRGGSIDVLDPVSRRLIRRFRHDPSLRSGLSGNDLRELLLDRAGQVWIGGYGTGLQRVEAQRRAIRVLRHSAANPRALSAPSVASVLELDDGQWWIGTRGNGIDVVDLARGVVDGFRPRANGPLALPMSGVVRALAQDGQGAIWAGLNDGLVRLDRTGGHFRPYAGPDGAPLIGVRRLLATHGGLWIGTKTDLYHWSSREDHLETIDTDTGGPLRDEVNALIEDDDGRLWVGTSLGLYTMPAEARRLRQVRNRSDVQRLRRHAGVLGMLRDRRGRMWLDTESGLVQMLRFDGESAEFDDVSTRLGIGGKSFGANLMEDRLGRIWTQWFVFDPQRDAVYRLTRADGVDIGTPWFRSYTRTRDGRFLIGGSAGLLVIDPEAFQPWDYQPPLAFTSLRIDGVPSSETLPAEGLQLSPGMRGFAIEFAALDFTAPERNRYQYRLIGYDSDWITTDASHRIAAYSNLRPGDYTLQVRGSNRTGAWSPHELGVAVRVLPAFWQTAWFAALILLAAWGAAYGGFRWRTARILARARELEVLVGQRTSELRLSHDRLQTSNAELATAHGELTAAHVELESTHSRLIDTQQQLMLSEKMAALGTLTAGVAHEINNPLNFADASAQNLREALEDLHRFLIDLAGSDAPSEVIAAFEQRFAALGEMNATTREGLGRIKAIVLDLRQFTRLDESERKVVSIAEPIQSTVNLIRTQFDRVRFELDLAFNPNIECQPAKLAQVFMNLIVNACEAIARTTDGREGVVLIQTRPLPNGAIEIEVRDNGCGMDAATQAKVFEPFFTTKPVGSGTGMGLAIAFGITKEHGGRIDVESIIGEGSRFAVTLPSLGRHGERR